MLPGPMLRFALKMIMFQCLFAAPLWGASLEMSPCSIQHLYPATTLNYQDIRLLQKLRLNAIEKNWQIHLRPVASYRSARRAMIAILERATLGQAFTEKDFAKMFPDLQRTSLRAELRELMIYGFLSKVGRGSGAIFFVERSNDFIKAQLDFRSHFLSDGLQSRTDVLMDQIFWQNFQVVVSQQKARWDGLLHDWVSNSVDIVQGSYESLLLNFVLHPGGMQIPTLSEPHDFARFDPDWRPRTILRYLEDLRSRGLIQPLSEERKLHLGLNPEVRQAVDEYYFGEGSVFQFFKARLSR